MDTILPDIFQKENKTFARTDFLKPWDKNPRMITERDYEKLKKDLKAEQFKPLLILDNGTVLGGNMRIRAYKENGVDKVWVSVVSLRTEGELVDAYVNGKKDLTFQNELDAMLHYANRDNSPYGKDDKDRYAEIIQFSTLPLDDYVINDAKPMTFEALTYEYGPQEEKPKKEKEPKTHLCPKCGHVFDE